MKLAALVGVSITDFWDMTPRELTIYAQAYAEKRDAEYEYICKNSIRQAYLTSRWVWQKRVNIKKYLNVGQSPKTMTDREMFNRIKALNTMMGGEIRQADI